MPGISGFTGIANVAGDSDLLGSMIQALTYRDDSVYERFEDESNLVYLGISSLGVLNSNTEPLLLENDIVVNIIDGELYGDFRSTQIWKNISSASENDLIPFLNKINGSYSLTIYDKQQKKLRLISDKLGTKPIYYITSPAGIIFASEIKAILEIPRVSKEKNLQAFADFFHFGFVLGKKTLFSNIHLLPPGTILTYDLSERTVKTETYWKLEDIFLADGEILRFREEEVAEQFTKAVQIRLGSLDKVGISLSGGLDSRAILAGMQNKAKGIHSYTLGLPGCQDEKLSAIMAEIAGTSHSFLEIGPKYLGEFDVLAKTLVRLSDGLYHPHESTEKRALDYFASAPFRIVLRGHGGEIAKAALAYPTQVTQDVKKFRSVQLVNDFMYNSANLVIRDVDPQKLFSPEFADTINDGARLSLSETLSPINKNLSPGDKCIYFYIQEWVRRQVIASLSIFRTQIEIRLPYLDECFLKSLLSLPLEKRFTGEVHKNIVRLCMPQLLKIVDSNTGAPMNSSKLRILVTEKINSLMRRFGIVGFRHYTEFQRWQREQFRESIQKIIFDERTLDRRMYSPQGLKEVFDLHVSGKKSYAHLLGTIVGLELWHRIFLDE